MIRKFCGCNTRIWNLYKADFCLTQDYTDLDDFQILFPRIKKISVDISEILSAYIYANLFIFQNHKNKNLEII